jgi:N-hydroxyarylamine O-acetyltransferase
MIGIAVEPYLARIGYDGPREPTIATLRAIHRAHLYSVPFENLDIGAGRPIVLDEAALFDKIVERRRGGFCYELNGLFALLLRALGFRVTLLGAGVRRSPDSGGPPFGPDFDHLTLLVELETPWLADVGFGDAFLHPLRLDTEAEQIDTGRDRPIVGPAPEGVWQDRYRIGRHEPEYLVLQRRDWTGEWHDRYRFAPVPRQWPDFAAMCHYHQTSPESGFTRSRTCTLATPAGRITIADLCLIVTEDGVRRETMLEDESARDALLRERFGVVV